MMANNIKGRTKRVLVDHLNDPIDIEQIHEDTSLYLKGIGFDSFDPASL